MANEVDIEGLSIAWESTSAPAGFVFMHATGFCKEVWHPVLEEAGRPPSLLVDQRGHGDSDVGDSPFDWWDLARDIVAVVASAPVADSMTGVGHSSGAAALVMAELLQPGIFDRLVLIEPIVLPPPFRRSEDHPLAVGALRRTRVFESRSAAADAYRERPTFAEWDDRAFDAYLDGGFRSTEEGWELKCRPEVEAEFYRVATAHGAWDRLGEIESRVDLVVGSASDSHPDPFVREQAAQFDDVAVHVVEQASHFVPMERPAAVARILASG